MREIAIIKIKFRKIKNKLLSNCALVFDKAARRLRFWTIGRFLKINLKATIGKKGLHRKAAKNKLLSN